LETRPSIDGKRFQRSIAIAPLRSRLRIVLGNAPWRRHERTGVRAGSRWPFTSQHADAASKGYVPFPFFLSYAASLAESRGFGVDLVDGIAEGLDEDAFVRRVRANNPDLVVLETSTPSIDVDLAMAERLKNEASTTIALSGPHASVFAQDVLRNPFVDYVLAGEYEETVSDLASAIEAGSDLNGVRGLCFRKDGAVVANPRRDLLDLNGLPWPARHLLPMYAYNDAFAGMPIPNVQMQASRGCPYGCIYCLWPQVMYGGRTYRTRDPVDVVNEMEWLLKHYEFKSVYFDDDTFNIGKKRMLQLCHEVSRRKIDIPWGIMARADTSDEETLKAMKDAGLYAIKYGVESGVQSLLDASGKSLDLEKTKHTVLLTKRLGIRVHLTFMFGLPGETHNTVDKTVQTALDLDPDSIQFSLATPFPGTEYFELADKRGLLLTKDWRMYDGLASPVIRTEQMTAQELQKALEGAYERWRKRLVGRKIRSNPLGYLKRISRSPGRFLVKASGLLL